MKKKFSAIVFMLLFFIAAGAFHYQGTQSTANASLDQSGQSSETEIESTEENKKDNTPQQKDTDNHSTDEKKPSTGTEETKDKQSDSGSTNEDEENTDTPTNTSENDVSPTDSAKQNESIILHGSEYTNIMDLEKFQELAAIAKKHGGILYALENTDLFVIMKDDTLLFSMSTGTASVPKENVGILLDFFADSEYQGLIENIKLVHETGAEVSVSFSETRGYSISQKNSIIHVTWG
ncbi:hypothetical protein FZC78_08175 [Rossellomorea vietnamensis]|uniref:Uncharacterized protein n=1 Tax=Rossellomorea vietnamensis TaxID=218284 RepID=A0A5D4NUC6_9BACI|nr:hypothetical protein [Rossellomorea vietnamensis]TYS17817.1 hypothetical protein FZC78_08175 [Rossellomorea vietnamensis]